MSYGYGYPFGTTTRDCYLRDIVLSMRELSTKIDRLTAAVEAMNNSTNGEQNSKTREGGKD